jgi:hypothetical protein
MYNNIQYYSIYEITACNYCVSNGALCAETQAFDMHCTVHKSMVELVVGLTVGHVVFILNCHRCC